MRSSYSSDSISLFSSSRASLSRRLQSAAALSRVSIYSLFSLRYLNKSLAYAYLFAHSSSILLHFCCDSSWLDFCRSFINWSVSCLSATSFCFFSYRSFFLRLVILDSCCVCLLVCDFYMSFSLVLTLWTSVFWVLMSYLACSSSDLADSSFWVASSLSYCF